MIPVRVTPKQLKGQANKYANNKMMVDRRHHDRPDRRERRADVQRHEPDVAARAGRLGIQRTAGLRHDDLRARHPGGRRPRRSSFVDGALGCGGPESALGPARWSRSRRRSRAKCRPTARRRPLRRAETGQSIRQGPARATVPAFLSVRNPIPYYAPLMLGLYGRIAPQAGRAPARRPDLAPGRAKPDPALGTRRAALTARRSSYGPA